MARAEEAEVLSVDDDAREPDGPVASATHRGDHVAGARSQAVEPCHNGNGVSGFQTHLGLAKLRGPAKASELFLKNREVSDLSLHGSRPSRAPRSCKQRLLLEGVVARGQARSSVNSKQAGQD